MTRTDSLRSIVEALDLEMSRLLARAEVGGDTTALFLSWAELVECLDLEVPPELRACPYCESVGLRFLRWRSSRSFSDSSTCSRRDF